MEKLVAEKESEKEFAFEGVLHLDTPPRTPTDVRENDAKTADLSSFTIETMNDLEKLWKEVQIAEPQRSRDNETQYVWKDTYDGVHNIPMASLPGNSEKTLVNKALLIELQNRVKTAEMRAIETSNKLCERDLEIHKLNKTVRKLEETERRLKEENISPNIFKQYDEEVKNIKKESEKKVEDLMSHLEEVKLDAHSYRLATDLAFNSIKEIIQREQTRREELKLQMMSSISTAQRIGNSLNEYIDVSKLLMNPNRVKNVQKQIKENVSKLQVSITAKTNEECLNCGERGHRYRYCKVKPYDKERVTKKLEEYKRMRTGESCENKNGKQ